MRVDLEHGDVAALVGTQNLGFVFTVVGQFHRHFLGPVNDVRVGEHESVAGYQETRALCMLHAVRTRHLAAKEL